MARLPRSALLAIGLFRSVKGGCHLWHFDARPITLASSGKQEKAARWGSPRGGALNFGGCIRRGGRTVEREDCDNNLTANTTIAIKNLPHYPAFPEFDCQRSRCKRQAGGRDWSGRQERQGYWPGPPYFVKHDVAERAGGHNPSDARQLTCRNELCVGGVREEFL